MVPEFESRASHLLGKHFTSEFYPGPSLHYLKKAVSHCAARASFQLLIFLTLSPE